MIKLTRLTNDIFDDPKLSDANLRTLADDHLIRVANKNPGSIYDGLITATTTAYTAYYGIMTNEAVKEAVSEGLTQSMNAKRDLVLARMSIQQGLISFLFGADNTTYQEFLPQGMVEYRNARLDNLTTILDRYLVAMNAHMPAAHMPEVNDITNLINDYKAARTAQRDAFSETDILRTGRRETRKELTLQLTRNILTLAIDYLDDPDGFDDYYDDSLLPKNSSGSDDDDEEIGPLTLSGIVRHSLTSMPLFNVEVTTFLPAGERTVFTTAAGTYVHEGIIVEEETEVQVRFRLGGFADRVENITLLPAEDQELNVTMTPPNLPPPPPPRP